MTQEPEADQTWPNVTDAQTNILEYPGLPLAALVESCEDAILSKDLDGIVTSWTPQRRACLGIPPIPMWVKEAIDHWTAAAVISQGRIPLSESLG